MADTTLQLKRKRESAIGLQKKAKKPRKSDAIAGQDAGAVEESVITAPVVEQIPVTQTTPQARDQSKSTSRKPQTNGLRDQDVSTSTSSHVELDEELPQAEQEEVADDGDATAALSKAMRKQNKKQRKLEYKASKKPEQLSEDKSADGSEAQGTPTRSASQAHDTDSSVKKKSLKERVSESKQTAKSELQDSDALVKTSKVQGTPARTTLQEQDHNNSTQKKTFKEKVLESKKIAKAEFKPFKEKVLESKEAAKAESKPQASTLAKTKKQKHKTSAKWAISPTQGGWFLPIDPVFSLDEKYIILANTKCLQIYFTETSLLASVLPIGSTGSVTAYALSSTKPSHVYVADSNGLITLWDWADGTKIGRWDIGATVRNMAVITQPGSDEDLVYCHEAGSSHIVNVHALRTNSQASKTELKRVLKTSSPITNVQVLLQGKYVIISTAESITVGKRLKVTRTAVQDFEYVWRELKFSKRVTTCHTYFRQPEVLEKGKRTAEYERDVLDLAVGDEIGVVLLFEDLLASFAAIEPIQKGERSRTDSAESFRPKRLHWHRDAVGSVKWSLDGNYLISGGDETVLTIWQLATGKPQHLPHLTAAIERVVVSPSGSSYALSLANNSVIVLSTTELDAKTNIVGVQTRRVDTDQLPRESQATSSALQALQPVPIAVDPKNVQKVLLTVPSSQPRHRNDGTRPQPYLQTFDIANQRPVTRQALTRNNATDPNMGPEGQRIKEPDVKFIQISHDGQWLATVDEWLPPQADTGYLNEGNADFSKKELLLRREVYLKIWRRDEKNGQWALETRIDAPHFLEDVCGNGRVFDLVAHPKVAGFATIGEDHVVRVWKPKTRLRDGVIVRGAGDRGLVNWSLHRSIELPEPNKLWLSDTSTGPQHARNLRLAYSGDGSVLAAGVSGTSDLDNGLVHLIDANSGAVQRSMTEIDATVLCDLEIIGRHLVVVTDSIIVWDLVCDDLVYCASINTTGVDRIERTSLVRLAKSEVDGTFAVSLPLFEKYESASKVKKVSSRLQVYSTELKEPIWSYTVPGITLGLAAKKGEKGYVALDSVSCIRTISPAAGSLALQAPQKTQESEVQGIEDIQLDDTEDDLTTKLLQLGDVSLEADYDKPVVTQQDLEEIFHNDNAPQAPKDVFSAVLRLFGGVGKMAA